MIDINKMIEHRFIGMNATRPGERGEVSRAEVAAIDDAMGLIHGEGYDILHAEDGRAPVAELHAGYTRASEALVAYFALADDRERLLARSDRRPTAGATSRPTGSTTSTSGWSRR